MHDLISLIRTCSQLYKTWYSCCSAGQIPNLAVVMASCMQKYVSGFLSFAMIINEQKIDNCGCFLSCSLLLFDVTMFI
jgi:hypothetical protein